MEPIFEKLIIAAAGPIVTAVIALANKSFRELVLYKNINYDLCAVRSENEQLFSCRWEITWAGYRLTFKADDISDGDLKGVEIYDINKFDYLKMERLTPLETFSFLEKNKVGFRIDSIVRKTPKSGAREYTIRVVLRRRRRIFG